MSRSYRKPWCTDGQKRHGRGYKRTNPRRYFKRLSNRMVRHDLEMPDGMAYRKNRLSWVICDWKYPLDKTDGLWYIKAQRK